MAKELRKKNYRKEYEKQMSKIKQHKELPMKIIKSKTNSEQGKIFKKPCFQKKCWPQKQC